MGVEGAKDKVLAGELLEKEELLSLASEDVSALTGAADEIRKSLCGNSFELCTIINGRSGKCPENCKYCAQSVYYDTSVEEYDLLTADEIEQSARSNEKAGVHRFSVVTSGKAMQGEQLERLCRIYRQLSGHCRIKLCASHGLLRCGDFIRLKNAGVERYHNNLETSRNYFPKICTTHTYDEKIRTIQEARQAGLSVCSGGILGLGETMEDRIDMALTLRELKVDSVPLNVLNPIAGTPLEHNEILSREEILRSVALFRFALPTVQLRLAGGRALMEDKGREAMLSGVNAAISGDMLTTSGICTKEDLNMLREIGFEAGR